VSQLGGGEEISASVLFEIGAAAGANKPIFVIVSKANVKLPFNVPNLRVLPMQRLEEVVRSLE
jgi:hypothetical protein